MVCLLVTPVVGTDSRGFIGGPRLSPWLFPTLPLLVVMVVVPFLSLLLVFGLASGESLSITSFFGFCCSLFESR